jgi:hypothetical protein
LDFNKRRLIKIVNEFESKAFEVTEMNYEEGQFALDLLQNLNNDLYQLQDSNSHERYLIFLHAYIATLSAPIFHELYHSFIKEVNNELNTQDSNISFKEFYFDGLEYEQINLAKLTKLYIEVNNPTWEAVGIGIDPTLPEDCINYILEVSLDYDDDDDDIDDLFNIQNKLKLLEFLIEYVAWLENLNENHFQTPYKDDVIKFLNHFYKIEENTSSISINKDIHKIPIFYIKTETAEKILTPTEGQWELIKTLRDFYPSYTPLKQLASIIYKTEIEQKIKNHNPPLDNYEIDRFIDELCSSTSEFADNIKKRKSSLRNKIKVLGLAPEIFLQSRTKHGYRLTFKF